MEIIFELSKTDRLLFAREIAEELDISSQSVAQRCRMLDLGKGLVERNKLTDPYTYKMTPLAEERYK